MIFIATKLFTSRIVEAMSDDVYAELQGHLSLHPDAGAIIPGAGGVRKIRWAGSGRGKRGGSKAARAWTVENGKRIETQEDVLSLRREFGVSQSAFAKFMGVSINTLQNWEQGRRQPTGAARVLLTIAHRQPALFRETVSEDYPEFAMA